MRETMSKPVLKIGWATDAAAKYACTNWHYSKATPCPPLVKIGVWEDDEFMGVVIFSRGGVPNLLKPFGLKQTEVCELTRVALKAHSSPVSRIIKIAIALLKQANPSLRLIVSFADPAEGHHGGIYQAGNWVYNGVTANGVEYIDKSGRKWHPRMIKKKGWTTVHGKQRAVLTPSQCLRKTTPGKHRYLMPLDEDMRRRVAVLQKPYPKRSKQATAETISTAAGQHRPERSNLSAEGAQIQTNA